MSRHRSVDGMRPSGRAGRIVVVTSLVVGLGVGAAACSDAGSQGADQQDVEEVRSRVSQLRLEVQTLRREVAALRAELEAALTSSGTTATTAPTTSTTSR